MQTETAAIIAVRPELIPDERLIWAGTPTLGRIFHKEDLFLVPFSLLWGGFALFWEAGVLGYWGRGSNPRTPWNFGIIWGIPFVLVGQYFIWGRFFYAEWNKRRTFYAVTNQRVIVVQDRPNRKTASAYIDTLPVLIKEAGSGTIGTLRFSEPDSPWSRRRGWSAWDSMAIGATPVFVDIEDVNAVYLVVAELRQKARARD